MPWQGGKLTIMVWGGLNPVFLVLTCCPWVLFSKQLEEEEQEDKFDLTVGVSDPEKVGELLSCTVGRVRGARLGPAAPASGLSTNLILK